MKSVIFSSALLMASTAMSATPVNGLYSSIFGGPTYLPGNVSTSYQGLTYNASSYSTGYHVGGRFGYQSNPLRYEGELTYIDAELRKFNVNNIRQTGVLGESDAILAMANIYYDFPDMIPSIQPFIGAGLGYGWVEGKLSSRGPNFSTYYKGSDSVFAYQATGGFTYNFAENYAINLAYRYVGTERVDELGKVFQAHLATVGVLYRFNEVGYK